MQNFWDSLKAFWGKLSPAWKLWLDRIAAGFIAAVMTAIVTTIMVRLGIQPAVIPPPPPDPIIVQHRATGYIKDPEAVKEAVASIEATQGVSVEFAKSAQQLLQGPDDDASAFMWDDEVKVYGDVKPSLDQGWVGSCTSQSTARCIQDILIGQVADGLSEKPPADVDSMTLYGGMRVNLGKGRFRGDGGINMWVFEYAQKYGVCFKQKYGDYDLSKYTPELAKKYGRDGVPPALLEVAKQHPVKTVARVSNANELWRALGSYYPVAIASPFGFEGRVPADGIMEPNGEWMHSMAARGRFVHPTKGKCVVIQNSWGNYLGKRIEVETVDRGKVLLPEGCFAVRLEVAGKMCASMEDSAAVSDVKGFPKKRKPWFTENDRKKQPDLFRPFLALAI